MYINSSSESNLKRVRNRKSPKVYCSTMGMVNLFADMSYEGGASINGPFLGTLGASAAAVSIIAGDGKVLSVGSGVKRRTVPDKGGKPIYSVKMPKWVK